MPPPKKGRAHSRGRATSEGPSAIPGDLRRPQPLSPASSSISMTSPSGANNYLTRRKIIISQKKNSTQRTDIKSTKTGTDTDRLTRNQQDCRDTDRVTKGTKTHSDDKTRYTVTIVNVKADAKVRSEIRTRLYNCTSCQICIISQKLESLCEHIISIEAEKLLMTSLGNFDSTRKKVIDKIFG